MKPIRLILIILTSFTLMGMAWLLRQQPPILDKTLTLEKLGAITISQPLWGSRGVALIFADPKKFPPVSLARRLAGTGFTIAMVDTFQYLQGFNHASGHCLDNQAITAAIENLKKALPTEQLIVAGIDEGALLPFINAQTEQTIDISNISIGFTVKIPQNLTLCPALTSRPQQLSATAIKGKWRSVWADQPAPETAIFIRQLGNVDTRIAAYDTPADTLLLDELNTIAGQNQPPPIPMPVVETVTANPGTTLTIFYSGDGGWRDLDRTVATEMLNQNYSVIGVDVLRYFWEHKTAEQASDDLATSMAYYRKKWGIKNFVLAGYSFGADILPAIYNRLPQTDKDSVNLMVLLALGEQADFEIHVSGWLGQTGNEQPLAPELLQLPKHKVLCIYGQEEKNETACTNLKNAEADILELPGGHHFDEDYPKLTRQILDVYKQHNM